MKSNKCDDDAICKRCGQVDPYWMKGDDPNLLCEHCHFMLFEFPKLKKGYKMKKIYVVTSGSYSDYHIDAMFSDKPLAEKYIFAFTGENNDMQIEDWILDLVGEEMIIDKKAFWVRMGKNGDSEFIQECDNSYGFDVEIPSISFTFRKSHMNCYCFAKDKEHAVKIANEKRIQYIANDKWGQ